MVHNFTLHTREKDQMIDITGSVLDLIALSRIKSGFAVVFCPHTTAGITINENADPDVRRDIIMRLNEIYPWSHSKDRHNEGNTAAHLKAITVGSSQTLLIENGKAVLGRWQGIYFCEFDGPRARQYHVKLM